MSQKLQDKTKSYDFFHHLKWINLIDGFGESRSFLYMTYIGLLYGIYLYLFFTSIYGFYHVYPNKDLVIGELHVFLNSIYGTSGITLRFLCDKYIKKLRAITKSEFYQYEDESMKIIKEEDVRSEIQNTVQLFIISYSAVAVSNAIFFPIAQYFTVSDEEYEATVDISNRYLPTQIYLPFSTRTPLGFIFGYVVNVLIFVFTYGIASSVLALYINTLVLIRVQLQILNYSIENIHKRALQMYKKRNGSRNYAQDDLYDDPEFQNCLYKCLRSNIEHHQVLMRFGIDARWFNGFCLLIPLLVSSVLLASFFYLIVQGPPLNDLIIIVVTLVSDFIYVYFLCIYGEQILSECTRLFSTIYSIPWYCCNKNFNVNLRIFMLSTKDPIKVKSHYINITACMERYGDFLLVVYKLLTILRQSDI